MDPHPQLHQREHHHHEQQGGQAQQTARQRVQGQADRAHQGGDRLREGQ